MRNQFPILGTLVIASFAGCDKAPPTSPTTHPGLSLAVATQAAQAETQPAAPPAILADADTWTLEECVARLKSAGEEDAERQRRSAAVRLVRLAQLDALAVPNPIPDDWARSLQVAALGENRWCLGVRRDERRGLGMPLLIDARGAVTSPVSEAEEEAAELMVSDDTDIFPHVLLVPLRVLLIEQTPRAALVAKSLGGARFDYRRKDDKWPYIALVIPNRTASTATAPSTASAPADVEVTGGADAAPRFIEVAVFRWDPDEPAFIGPASDKLPDPPGGKFEIDVQASKALIPVGGEILEIRAPAAPRKPKRVEPPPE